MDKFWTKIGRGQNLDKGWTSNFITCPLYKIDKTLTKTGHLIVQGLSNTNNIGQGGIYLTILGQITKILDKNLTIF